jgi:hypothetical protein
MNTLAFRRSSSAEKRYLVLIHNASAPDAAEWQAYVREMDRTLAEAVGTVHAFVVTDGGGPDAVQRRELADIFGQRHCSNLTHVFTNDMVVRAIVTAFRWIGRAHAVAHLPSAFPFVCAECGLSAVEVLHDFREAEKELGRVRMLQQLEDALQSQR